MDSAARRRFRSIRIEGAADPLDAGLDQHHVEAAGRQRPQAADEVARREHDPVPLEAGDAAAGTAVPAAGPGPHLDEDQGTVARIAHHQVDLAAAAARRPIIARDQPQPGRQQMRQRLVFGRVAALLGGRAGSASARPALEIRH